jgi:hypothetical protein
MNATIQIAQVLNVSPNQIKSVREMAWVYCVVVSGQRATFVSKKKVEAVKMIEVVCNVAAGTIKFKGRVNYTLNDANFKIKYEGEIAAADIPFCITDGMTQSAIESLAKQATADWLAAVSAPSAPKPAAQISYEQDMAKIDAMEARMYAANSHH